MRWWQLLLYPFAILYDLATRFRNHLYNIGTTPSFDFETNVISVGNLSIGGTGKSPMVEYIIEYFLAKNLKVSILSRGYGRKTKGFLVADQNSSAIEIGDESLHFHQRFGENVCVAVGEDRAFSIPQILMKQEDNDIIVLDDGFQHRRVNPNLSILLTTYQNPFYKDRVIPAGTLRESKYGARRAGVIIMTKCPADLSNSERDRLENQLRKFNEKAKIFFTTNRYYNLKPIFKNSEMRSSVVALAGTANPKSFFKEVSRIYNVVATISFPDHHRYKSRDIRRILSLLKDQDRILICTMKDAVKLSEFKELEGHSCFGIPYLPGFLSGEHEFKSVLDLAIQSYNRESFD